MNFKSRIRYLFSFASLNRIFRNFIEILAILWLFIEFTAFFALWINQNKWLYDNRGSLFIGLIVLSFVITIVRAVPPVRFIKKSANSNFEIEIVVGNLLEQSGSIAIGCSDCFDTEPETVIGPKSLMAQIVKGPFHGNSGTLDAQIIARLNNHGIAGLTDASKPYGKKERYAIGTVAAIPVIDKRVFFTVFSTANNDDKATRTTKEDLWKSLSCLWDHVRSEGFNEPITVPVWGSGLARAQASRISLIHLVFLSFIMESRERLVCKKLRLMITEQDYDPGEFRQAIGILESVKF